MENLKSFTSHRGKFIYTYRCTWVGPICKPPRTVCFSHSCPLCPINHQGKSWLRKAPSPNWLDQTFHRSKGNCIGLKGLLFQFLLTRNKQKFCLGQRSMQLSRTGDGVNMDFAIQIRLGQHFPVAPCAFPNPRAGHRDDDQYAYCAGAEALSSLM